MWSNYNNMKKDEPIRPASSFYRETDTKSLHDDIFTTHYKRQIVSKYPIKNDMYICNIGIAGRSSGRINTQPYTMRPHGISFHLPGDILEQSELSDDFECLCVAMSEDFFRGLGLTYDFRTLVSIQDSPMLDMSERQFAAAVMYYDMVDSVLGSSNPYKREIIRHLTCAYFYGLGYFLYQKIEGRKLSNDETLMQSFIKTVQQNYKRERKVAFYADELNLSVGYLATVVKKVSGRTPTEWIDDYVTLEAKALLKSHGLTVQQVSNELNFPSQSFFGKYFKRHTGMSPKEYKNK